MSTYDKFAPCKLTRREMTSGMLYLATLSFTVDILNDLVTAPLPMLCCWDEKRFSSLDEKNVDEFILPCHRRRPWEQFDHGLENCFADNPFYWVDYLVLRLKFTCEVAPTTFDKVLSILNLLHRSSNWVTFSWHLVSRSCNGKIFLIQFGHGQLVPIEKKKKRKSCKILPTEWKLKIRIKSRVISSTELYSEGSKLLHFLPIPLMPLSLLIQWKRLSVASRNGKTNQSQCQFSGPCSTFFHLWLKGSKLLHFLPIPLMPLSLLIQWKRLSVASRNGKTNQSQCQFSGPCSTFFHLWLWQLSFHWIVSERVVSGKIIFLPIWSDWYSLDPMAVCLWLRLQLQLRVEMTWKPAFRLPITLLDSYWKV